MLGLAFDEQDEDEDDRIEIDDIPFIMENDLLLKYGSKFAISFTDGQVAVKALAQDA